jgi:hypothetical protein
MVSYAVKVSSSVEYTVDVEIMMSVYVEVSTVVDRMGSDGIVIVVITGSPNMARQPKSCSAGLLSIYPATWDRQEPP